MRSIIVIDSGGSNLSSVKFAFERLGVKVFLSEKIEEISSADKLLLPGVGNAGYIMKNLKDKGLIEGIRGLKQPVLGICLGMQILFDKSEEGDVDCLGIIPGKVRRIPDKPGFPVPHMGWNTLEAIGDHALLKDVGSRSYCYFVHSFYAPVSQWTIARSAYSLDVSAIVKKDNFYGCQFHPEKSGRVGAGILKNFLEIPS